MIDDLIDFTRGQLGGGIPVSRAGADFAAICRAAIEELRAADVKRDIVFEHDGDLHGVWDAERVHQAISNLIANAVHHGTGTVSVRAEAQADQVALTVHNFGPPIPPQQIAGVFEPFRKAGTSSKGLGLGLYIVKEIVRSHGGTVEVKSSADEGTTFVSRWPRYLHAYRTEATADEGQRRGELVYSSAPANRKLARPG
jgi:signal transduction histidine kinase